MGKYVVSSCLLGKNCKYNGGNNYNEELVEFLKDKEVIEICPEVMGGMETPRVPIEVSNGRVINKDGIDKTNFLTRGTKKCLDLIKDQDVICLILQSRSPSCGVNKIYDGTFSKTLIEADGFFVREARRLGYKVIDVNDFIKSINKSAS